jgi:hypothetical protein
MSPGWGTTARPTDGQSQCDFDSDFDLMFDRIRQEDVVLCSSVVDVLTLGVL